MSRWVLFLFLVLAFAICSGHQKAASSSPIRTENQQLPAKPGEELNLDLDTGGSVVLQAWDQNIVKLETTRAGRDAAECEVKLMVVSGGIQLRSRYVGHSQSHSTQFHFDFKIPRNFNVRLNSAGGSVRITGVNGNFRGSTGGGGILIQDAAGTVNLATGGGDIRIARSQLDGHVSTGGGDIQFDRVTGTVTGDSGSGSVIRNESARVAPASYDGLQIVKDGGDIEIDHAPNGIRATTGGGNIKIGHSANFVSAETGGGDIHIDAVDGWIKATTGGGDITARIIDDSGRNNHDVHLDSGSGNITLIVPSSFSMDLDLKIGYTKRAPRVDIISDFPLQKRFTDEWSTREGTARKYIFATGNIGGGKNRIHISTVNGNIYLKRQ